MFAAPKRDLVTPSITSNAISWFNGGAYLPQGEYQIRYESGLMRYGAIGYSVNDPVTLSHGFKVVIDRGADYDYLEYVLPGTCRQSANPQQALANNAGIRPFTVAYRHLTYPLFDAQPIRVGVYLFDTPYYDNTPWTITPAYSLTTHPYNNNTWPENTEPQNISVAIGTPNLNSFLVSYYITYQTNPLNDNLILTPPWVDCPCTFVSSAFNKISDNTWIIQHIFEWTDPARPAPLRYNISWGDVYAPRSWGTLSNSYFEYKNVQASGWFE